MCDINSCQLKRALRMRGLEQELKHSEENGIEDNSSEKVKHVNALFLSSHKKFAGRNGLQKINFSSL